jgi:hypothetical protein
MTDKARVPATLESGVDTARLRKVRRLDAGDGAPAISATIAAVQMARFGCS